MKHLVSVLLLVFITTGSFAAAQLQKIHNVVKNVSGNAFVKDKNKDIIAIKNGASLKSGDIIFTGPGSSFEVHFEDESVMTVTSLTVMKVDELLANQNPGQSEPSYQSKFKLRVGEVKASVSRKTGVLKKFEVQTPVGTASVRGTEKIVNYSPDAGMKVNTLHGQVLVMANNGIERYVNQGEFTKALDMQTKLPQAELQVEQAKPFITNESEQYILENKGLEVTQEANQILVSQVTKEQNQDPEAIVEAHQEAQQGASKTPDQDVRLTTPLMQELDEAEALKRAEAVFEQRFEQRYQEIRAEIKSQLPPVPTATQQQNAVDTLSRAAVQPGAAPLAWVGTFVQEMIAARRQGAQAFETYVLNHPTNAPRLHGGAPRQRNADRTLAGMYRALPDSDPTLNTDADRAAAFRRWIAGLIEVEAQEARLQGELDRLERESVNDKSKIIAELKAQYIEAQKAEKANFKKEFEARMQGNGQSSQQVQQLVNINKLVAGL